MAFRITSTAESSCFEPHAIGALARSSNSSLWFPEIPWWHSFHFAGDVRSKYRDEGRDPVHTPLRSANHAEDPCLG